MKKLDKILEETHVEHVDHDMAHLIQKARQDKNWTQKELGMHINEKADVVRDYESGKAVPNSALIVKMEKALEVKLRGPKAGRPIVKQQPEVATAKEKQATAKGKKRKPTMRGHK